MSGQTLGLHRVGQRGIVPLATSPAHHDLISTSAQYLSAFTYTSLSSGYLMSSSMASGLMPISRPFNTTPLE